MTRDRAAAPVLTVVGSGTLVPHSERHSASHHLRTETASVLLDCGAGTVHGLNAHGIDWSGLTHIAITHYHCDHVGDLASLMFALKHGLEPARVAPLKLIGPPGFATFLGRLSEALGSHVLEPGFDVEVIEVAPSRAYEDGDVTFTCASTPHAEESIAFRVQGPWGSLGYTGDTGPSVEVARFLEGCDVLIAECALTDPPHMDLHLSPKGLGRMASVANAGLLIVTHVYPYQTPDEAVHLVRQEYPGPTEAAADGMRVRWGADGPTVDRPGTPV